MRVPARSTRYAVKPTHCVRGCGRALTPSRLAQSRYYCSPCDGLRRGRQPTHRGPCLAGCGRRGRGRSGYCTSCYSNLIHKRMRRQRLLRAVLGHSLPLDWIVRCWDQARAQKYARDLLAAVVDGRIAIADGRALAEGARERHRRERMSA